MNLIIRAAARMLPAPMRDRYREQWLADARDAAEAGLSPASIALAAVTFALAAPRPIERRRQDSPSVTARARLASALALSAAVIGVSQFGNAGSNEGLTSSSVYNVVVVIGTAVMVLYLGLAPIVAIVLVSVTRGTPARIRAAVWLLAASVLGAASQGLINSIRSSSPVGSTLLAEAALALALPVALCATGGALIIREYASQPQPRSRLRGMMSLGVGVAALGLGLANVVVLRDRLHAADVEFVRTVLDGDLDGAAAMLAQSGQATEAAVVVWAVVGLAACLGAAWIAYTLPRRALASTLALLFALMIMHAGVLTYVWLSSFGGPGVHLTVPEAVLLLVGRWGLVAVVLVSVGGVRLTGVRRLSGTGRRHDITATTGTEVL